MITKLSTFIAKSLFDSKQISESEFLCYVYCFEYFFENLFYISFILLFSAIHKQFLLGVLFLIILVCLRRTAGGIHAPTRLLCTLFSYGIAMITIIFLIFYMSNMVLYYSLLSSGVLIVSISVLLGIIKNRRDLSYES